MPPLMQCRKTTKSCERAFHYAPHGVKMLLNLYIPSRIWGVGFHDRTTNQTLKCDGAEVSAITWKGVTSIHTHRPTH